MLGLLNFLKGGKVLAILGAIAVAILFGWYVADLKTDNTSLEQTVTELRQSNRSLQEDMERQRQDYDTQIRAYESSLEMYMSSLAIASNTNDVLKEKLNEIGEYDEELEACLERELPDDVFSGLL